jgi:hypothetical protein
MWGVETLRIKQYGEYQLSAINDSRESIKNYEYFLGIRSQMRKAFRCQVRSLVLEEIVKKSQAENLVVLVPDSKSRNIPEVVVVRRRAGGVLGSGEGWVNRVKGGANGVSLQAT